MSAIIDEYPDSFGADSASRRWEALTPSDTVNFVHLPKYVAVGAVAGSFVAVGDDGVTCTFTAAAGQILKIRPIRINATGLTPSMTFVGLR